MPSMSISPARLRRGLLPLAAALALMAAPAWSQTTEAPAEPSFDDATLQSFAAAANEVGEISSEWSQKMQEVEDSARLENMRQNAQDEMVEAVEDEGITVETYNRILQVAETDPDLGERIRTLMDEQAAQ